jgi:hypothetical protein
MSGKSANETISTNRLGAKFEQLGERELDSVSAGGFFRISQGGSSSRSEIEVEKEVDRTSVPLVQA